MSRPTEALRPPGTGHALTFGALLLLGGRMADLLGRRRLLTIGLAVFGAASLDAGVASSPVTLIVARFAQGAGGALISPAALSLLTTLDGEGPERRRAVAGDDRGRCHDRDRRGRSLDGVHRLARNLPRQPAADRRDARVGRAAAARRGSGDVVSPSTGWARCLSRSGWQRSSSDSPAANSTASALAGRSPPSSPRWRRPAASSRSSAPFGHRCCRSGSSLPRRGALRSSLCCSWAASSPRPSTSSRSTFSVSWGSAPSRTGSR